jgi:polygalacturonase
VKGNVLAANAKNIRISGRGILDGRQLERGVNLIALSRVEKAAIEGITLVGCKTWTVKPTFSRDLVIDNLKIVNWDTGSDGIDLVGTSYVRIQNCFVRANDDCIVIKTWGGDEKYPRHEQVGPDVEDIQVLNSVFWNMPWGNALEIGFELRASTIRDVLFKNCDIIHVERGAALSIHNGDYATVENIRYEDIRVEDARHKLIDLAVFLSQYSTDRPQDPEVRKSRYMNGAWDGVLWVLTGEEGNYAAKRGRIRNISFKNIRVVDSPSPFSVISGYDPQHRVENVTIEDLYINGKKVTSLAEGRIMVEQAEGVVVK